MQCPCQRLSCTLGRSKSLQVAAYIHRPCFHNHFFVLLACALSLSLSLHHQPFILVFFFTILHQRDKKQRLKKKKKDKPVYNLALAFTWNSAGIPWPFLEASFSYLQLQRGMGLPPAEMHTLIWWLCDCRNLIKIIEVHHKIYLFFFYQTGLQSI